MTLDELKDKIITCEGFVNLNSDDVNKFSSKASYKLATISEETPMADFQKFVEGIRGNKVLICLFLTHESKVSMQALTPLSDFAESLSPGATLVWGTEYQPVNEMNLQVAAIYE